MNDYNVAFIYFGHDKSFDIRVTGASAIKNLEKEIKKLYELKSSGTDLLKLPDITHIIELDSEFCKKHDIPMTISMSNNEIESFSKAQKDMLYIEKSAKDAIGEESFRVDPSTRCEKWKEFFSRVAEEKGITYEQYLENIARELSEKFNLPVSMQKLESGINFLDNKYAFGQKFGQATRIVENPFRMTDLKAEIINAIRIGKQSDEQKQVGQKNLKEIISFSAKCLGLENEQDYLLKYAETMGKNIAGLLNENWMYNNWAHRQDFSLSGELCDDAFEKVAFYEESELIENQDNASDKHKQEMTQQKKKYFNQIYLFASNMKIIEDAYKIAGLEIPPNYREVFIDNIFENLTIDKKVELTEILKSSKNIDVLSDIYEINPSYTRVIDEATGQEKVKIENSESVYKNFEGYEEYVEQFRTILLEKTQQVIDMNPELFNEEHNISSSNNTNSYEISTNAIGKRTVNKEITLKDTAQKQTNLDTREYENPNIDLDNKNIED